MDNDCRHFILLSNIEMNYAQKLPAECQEDDKACKCFTESAAFMGPNRKFVSWQMYHDDHNGKIKYQQVSKQVQWFVTTDLWENF